MFATKTKSQGSTRILTDKNVKPANFYCYKYPTI